MEIKRISQKTKIILFAIVFSQTPFYVADIAGSGMSVRHIFPPAFSSFVLSVFIAGIANKIPMNEAIQAILFTFLWVISFIFLMFVFIYIKYSTFLANFYITLLIDIIAILLVLWCRPSKTEKP